MIRTTTTGLILLALVAITTLAFLPLHQAEAHPRPKILSDSWQLDFVYEKPALITVDLPGEGPTDFWYLPYTVTNNTGQELLFVPDVMIYTDAGDLILAPRKVPPVVFTAVKAELRNPLLESPIDIIGQLLQGEDNARDGVILWPAPNHDIDSFKIFVGGLSGETAILDPDGTIIPEKADSNDEADIDAHAARKRAGIVLRKTLVLEVATPGDIETRTSAPVVMRRSQWIMR